MQCKFDIYVVRNVGENCSVLSIPQSQNECWQELYISINKTYLDTLPLMYCIAFSFYASLFNFIL